MTKRPDALDRAIETARQQMKTRSITKIEKAFFRWLPNLLKPFKKPTAFVVPTDPIEQAALDAERREVEKEIADFEQKYPELAARENARLEREEKEIRARIFGTQNEEV